MIADLNADLAFSPPPGSPPASTYRTPPMVRNRVATAARMPTSQAVLRSITVGRSLTARMAGVAACRWSIARYMIGPPESGYVAGEVTHGWRSVESRTPFARSRSAACMTGADGPPSTGGAETIRPCRVVPHVGKAVNARWSYRPVG